MSYHLIFKLEDHGLKWGFQEVLEGTEIHIFRQI